MSKYKVGDKFIIEIGHVIVDPKCGAKYFVRGFRNIAFDDYGLNRLEHVNCGVTLRDAYDEGYEKGQRDAWNSIIKQLKGVSDETDRCR